MMTTDLMTGRSRGLSLKATLAAVVATLAILVLLACGIAGVEAWHGYVGAGRVAEVNANTDLLLKGLESIQLERGQTNTALQGPTPVTAQVKDLIAKRRADGDPSLSKALDQLTASGISGGDRLIADVRQAYDRVKQARQGADTALQVPKDQRDAALLKSWYPVVSDLLAKIQTLWAAASGEVSKEDAIVGQLTTVKQNAIQMREYAGRERAMHAANLSANRPLSAEQQREIANWRGYVQSAWQTIRDVSAGGAPRLLAAVAEADRGFVQNLQTHIEAISKAGIAGSPYPLSVQQWFEISNPALELIVRIKDAAVDVTAEHAAKKAGSAELRLILVIALTMLGIAVSAFSIWVVSHRVARPLLAMTAAMRQLAEGDSSIDIPALQRADEIGEMARSVEVFRENAIKADAVQADQETERQKKDRRQHTIDSLTGGFDLHATTVLERVASSIAEMRATAAKMSGVATENASKSSAVAAAAHHTSINVQTVAAATEELSASVAEIGRQVTYSAGIAAKAVEEADQTNADVQSLATMTEKIGDIMKLINDIAAQTNLLALNATIEAARAGEAGKGFAVVASEVKTLANQTSKATEEISSQISAIQGATHKSVKAIAGIGKTIGEISHVAAAISAAVEEQRAATQAIAHNVQQAANGTQDVSTNVVGVTEAASDTGAAAMQVEAAASTLSVESQRLREHVGEFLAQVRAA
jgi:methyl-accepting chemotaxis protein